MATTTLTRDELVVLAGGLQDMVVSRPWVGYASAVFLELGTLRQQPLRLPSGRTHRRTKKGEATVMIEWSWRVEGPRSIQFGSWSGDQKIENQVAALGGRRVVSIDVTGRIPELVIELTGQRWLHSFMTAEGQPQWVLFLPDRSHVCVQRGLLTRVSKEHV